MSLLNNRKWVHLLTAIVLCEMVGLLGSIFTVSSVRTWYPLLVHPRFNPPAWVFGPVWTLLFVLMGVSVFLVYEKGFHKKEVRRALWIFFVQLILNFLWSILFFGLQSPVLAFVDIIFLWSSIVVVIFLFFKIQKTAAYLLLPYIAWVSFAMYLNFALWRLN